MFRYDGTEYGASPRVNRGPIWGLRSVKTLDVKVESRGEGTPRRTHENIRRPETYTTRTEERNGPVVNKQDVLS